MPCRPHIQHIGLDGTNGQTATLVIVLTTAVLFWIGAPFFATDMAWFSGAALLFAASGILRPTISISLWTHGIRLLGPTLNAGLGSSGPIFTAIFAYLIVGEIMTTPVAIGTGLVVAGILVAALRGSTHQSHWPAWAVLLPMSAELCRAIAHSLTKLGYGEVSDPFFAGMLATTTGAIVLSARYIAQGQRVSATGPGIGWFIFVGHDKWYRDFCAQHCTATRQGHNGHSNRREFTAIRDAS